MTALEYQLLILELMGGRMKAMCAALEGRPSVVRPPAVQWIRNLQTGTGWLIYEN